MRSTPDSPPDDNAPAEAARDAWAVQIARVSGIPLRLHFTFLLIVIWFAFVGVSTGSGGTVVLALLGLFTCIALHELGHSLVAQRLGYRVRDITLYPIGGVAAIEGSPPPAHELAIALAGPLVNVVIAGGLFAYLSATGHVPSLAGGGPSRTVALLQTSPLAFLYAANITLVLFNMIPAFPMDGGRVLRALLGLVIGKPRATRIAAGIGQLLAIVMGMYGTGILGGAQNIGLVIIALFVFFGAGQEREMEQAPVPMDDTPVRAAMVSDFQTLIVGDTLERASEVLLATSQHDFPVMVGADVAGVLSRDQLLRGLAQHGPTAYVAGEMTRDPLMASADDPLEPLLMRPDGIQHAPVLVRDAGGTLVGMVTRENVIEYLTLRRLRQMNDGA